MSKSAQKQPAEDPREILCERCGYVLDDTPREGRCPECGSQVLDSLPERRTGTEWERPGRLFRRWRSTLVQAVLRPSEMYLLLQGQKGSVRLLCLNALAACAPLMIGVTVFAWSTRPVRHTQSDFSRWPVMPVLWEFALKLVEWWSLALILAPVVIALSVLEAFGFGFIANRRGWRNDRRLLRSICAHASVGWLASGVGVALAALVNNQSRLGSISLPYGIGISWVYLLLLVGFLPGLVWFETLAYLGLRRCRYANVPARSE